MSKLDFSQHISEPAVRPEDILAGNPSSAGPIPPILRSRSGSLRGLSAESVKADSSGGGTAALQPLGVKPMTIRRAASGFFTQLSQIKRVESVGRMFSTESSAVEGSEKQASPAHSVLSHALILWLGDLNYRYVCLSIYPSPISCTYLTTRRPQLQVYLPICPPIYLLVHLVPFDFFPFCLSWSLSLFLCM